MPGPIGPKHIEIAKKWIPSLGLYGAAGVLGVFYITEFRTLLQWVPFYNLKYRNWPPLKTDEE